MITELKPEFINKTSFLGKAVVNTEAMQGTTARLISFGKPVAEYSYIRRSVRLAPEWCNSSATILHVREFISKMTGLEYESGAAIQKAIESGRISQIYYM